LITRYLPKNLITCYLGAEITGALLASIFVKYAIGTNANLGANVPNYNFPLPIIFGIEVLASSLLKIVILLVIYTKGLKGFSGIVIGGIIGLDIFFFGFISGESMNPERPLAPALLSGSVGDLWLYWTTAFIGTSIAAISLRHKFE
jgi:glycerol uptake facilitator-like aquaporin